MALSQKQLQKKRENKKIKKKKNTVKNSSRQNYIFSDVPILAEDRRIMKILAPDKNPDSLPPDVNTRTLQIYCAHLEKTLPKGMLVTGMDDMGFFEWEESYWFDVKDDEECQELKIERGSCSDTFSILEIEGV